MIQLVNLGFKYLSKQNHVFQNLNLDYAAGEFALICGPTGSGKSSMLGALVGLVPHYSGGVLSGRILLGPADITRNFAGLRPADYSSMVGYVNQRPGMNFVTQTVAEELAFGLEQRGTPPTEMSAKVLLAAEKLGIEDLLHRNLNALSGGQQQRVAIAAAICGDQKILLLDEPTSALDFEAAEALLHTLRSLASEHGYTVLLVEHRIELALKLVDSVTVLDGQGSAVKHSANNIPVNAFGNGPASPMAELARKLGWPYLPRTVAAAAELWQRHPSHVVALHLAMPQDQPSVQLTNLNFAHGKQVVLGGLNLNLFAGEVAAVIGPNGVGKSTLLNLIWERNKRDCVLLPQDSDSLLMAQTVAQELADADSRANADAGSSEKLFSGLVSGVDVSSHPRDLSAGQRVALALAIQLVRGGSLVLLDEPTRGLDYQAKQRLQEILSALAAEDKTVLVASHDSEFVATCANRVHKLVNGKIESTKSPSEALATLGEHTPQLFAVTASALRLEQIEVHQ